MAEAVPKRLGLPPRCGGFGLELLRRVVPFELFAETAVEFRPDGQRFTPSMRVEGNGKTT